ncbi:MAG TPA: hypothetical protein VGQ31_00360 [Candidatus Limnocylindrales bacterium]|jgi:dipeptidyl aminopeptidase/acylaminoacyl peptidase|nr:hypothetical protein [Candidatus Limnocylindrales bacterium]
MKPSMTRLTDDQIRDALLREPALGLGAIVADGVAREVAVRPQRRRAAVRWPWSGHGPSIVDHLWAGRIMRVAVVALLVAGLLISIAVAAALLRRPNPLRNGSIAFGPPEGGVTVVDASGHVDGHWSDVPALFVTWSRDGGRLAFWSGASKPSISNDPTSQGWSLMVLDPRTGTLTPVHVPETWEPNGPLQWSNDGRSITSNVLVDGSPAAVITDLRSGTTSRLGPAGMDSILPTWSDAGDRLALLAEPRFSNAWRLYLADADGAHPVERSVDFPAGFDIGEHSGQAGMAMQSLYPLVWSPDGARILLTATRADGSTAIFVLQIEDGSLTALTPSSVDPLLSRWSPDGSSIAFISFDGQRQLNDLYVIDADGSNLRRVAMDACEFVDWAPDSSRILFDAGLCDTNASSIQVRTVRADGSDLQTVWSEPVDLSGEADDMLSVGWQGLRP